MHTDAFREKDGSKAYCATCARARRCGLCSQPVSRVRPLARGTILGNQMSMSLDGTWPTSGGYHREWHSPAVGIGGPAFSILMALIALIFVEKRRTVFAFPFLFFPLFARLFALTLGGFAAQDEAGISASLGLGKYTVAIIVCSTLLVLVWKGSLDSNLVPSLLTAGYSAAPFAC